jgi:diguanylate cyclase (GGDEF)-like protein
MIEPAHLSETIASTATIKLAQITESRFFCTPIEERFERLTRLGKRALNAPVAAITFINAHRQWFKSVAGWAVTELPYDQSLCAVTLAQGSLTVIEDTAEDPRTNDNPLVTSNPRFRFYAGYPLRDESNIVVGTYCVMDQKPRKLSQVDREALIDLAALTQRELVSEQLRSVHTALTSKLGVARRESMMDPLTRLWNRRGAMVMVKSAIEEADEAGTTLAMALLDLDNFKHVNDTYGHQTGDEVLRKTASRLIRNVRVRDVVCRVGGDEFLLVLPGVTNDDAREIVERVRAGVTELPVPTREGRIPTSTSIGYALRAPGEQVSVDELMARADRALLAAKGAGRDRAVVAS